MPRRELQMLREIVFGSTWVVGRLFEYVDRLNVNDFLDKKVFLIHVFQTPTLE